MCAEQAEQIVVPRGAFPERVDVLDTTLRDGSQQEGLSLTVDDKLRVAQKLDELGVTFIEGGWPGANPKDDEFFARAVKELTLSTSTLVAFGSTRRAGGRASEDEGLARLVESGAPVACIVAKSWDVHVTDALRTTLEEALEMVADSVSYLRSEGMRVLLDAEHFFDGYKANRDFALAVVAEAERAGAEAVVLCDTNGGSLPHEVEPIVADVVSRSGVVIGIHCHNDGGVAVANTLAAVKGGARHVQGCLNGYGERTGNADLCSVIPDLMLKLGVGAIPEDRLERLTSVAHHVAELVNVTLSPQRPYVGSAAFAHKGGLHVSAIVRRRDAYEHVAPELVGNGTRVVVSEMAGRSTIAIKAEELGLQLDSDQLAGVVDRLKELEHQGYHFEVADGSLELLMREAAGWRQPFFSMESFRVITDRTFLAEEAWRKPGSEAGSLPSEATVKLEVEGKRLIATAEGNGPVNALDAALRKAIEPCYPALSEVRLTDYRVRVLDTGKGTGAITRVLIDSTNGESTWTTIGVSENVIEASWQALSDSIVCGLLRAGSLQSLCRETKGRILQ
jgi:2-isopropylmalate synthase